MKAINAGHILTFYEDVPTIEGACKVEGLIVPANPMLAFQVIIPQTITATDINVFARPVGTTNNIPLDCYELSVSSNAELTIIENKKTQFILPPSLTYFHLVLQITGYGTLYSCPLKEVADLDCYSKIEFWNDCDTDFAYYSGGYKQEYYFAGYEGNAIVEETEEVKTNGEGLLEVLSRIQKEFVQVTIFDVLNENVGGIQNIRGHSNVEYTNELGESLVSKEVNIDIVDTDCHNQVDIQLLSNVVLMGACCEDKFTGLTTTTRNVSLSC